MTNRKRDEIVIYLVGFLDMLAVGLFIPLFPKYARQIGISALNIGLFGSIYGCLQFFSGPILGGWADKVGKKSVLIKCLLMSLIEYSILGMTDTIWLIFLSRVISGTFKHTQSLTKAYLVDITDEKHHLQAFGYQSSISNLGFIFGPTLGGIIVDVENGFHTATLLGAFLFLVQAIIVHFVLDEEVEHQSLNSFSSKKNENSPELKSDSIYTSLKEILKTPRMRDVFLIQFLLSASSLLFRENASLVLHVRYQTSARAIGFMISFSNFVSSVSGFFVAELAKRYDNNDSKIMLHCTYVHVIAVLASTFAPEFLIYVTFLVPYKLSQAVSRVAMTNMMVENSHGAASGELMGVSQSIFAVSRILAPTACGLLQEISVLVPGLLAGLLGIIIVPVILWSYSTDR
jgi:MFS family permease